MQLEYEIELPEFMEMAWLRHRSSVRWIVGVCVGVLGLLMGAFLWADRFLGVVLVGFSIFLLLMQLMIPSLVFRRVYRRNRRMFGVRTVNISDSGIVSDHQLGHSETTWQMYEKFLETKKLFLLYQSPDLIGILSKRAFPNTVDEEQFRSLVASKIRRA